MNNRITHKAALITLLFTTCTNLAYFNWFSYAQPKKVEQQTEGNHMITQQVKTPLLLSFLYKKNSFGRIIRYGITKKWFSSLAGLYCDQPFSTYHIASFIEEHKINISEAQKSVSEFTTFNDFFVRELKPESRPIDNNPTIVISPADGHVIIIENSSCTMRFPIKQSLFSLEQFLGNKSLANSFEGGTIMIFRLAPHDYHRFHFPIACIPGEPITINGRYESVNPIVYYTGIQPLTENERHVYILKTEDCDDIAMASVGALCVGKIKETYTPAQLHQKGQEGGYFCFGGSTLVLVFQKGVIEVSEEVLNNSKIGKETPIKMGQAIAKIIKN